MPGDFETIGEFRDLTTAHFYRNHLEMLGINAFLVGEHMAALQHPWSWAAGGVKLQVPADEAAEARAILRDLIAMAKRGELEADSEDAPTQTSTAKAAQMVPSPEESEFELEGAPTLPDISGQYRRALILYGLFVAGLLLVGLAVSMFW